MSGKIKIYPAPHDSDYNEKVVEHLLEDKCKNLCLEFPEEMEKYFREYANGDRSYIRLLKALRNSGAISKPFESGYEPIFRALPNLKEENKGFKVYCFEDFDTYNDWVFKRDEFVKEMVMKENLDEITSSYEELVQETKKRNREMVQNLKNISEDLETLHVLTGRLHGPMLREILKKEYGAEEVIVEDIAVTPLDESIILRLQGRELEDLKDVFRRHRKLGKEGKGDIDVMDILRDEEMIEKYDLKRYSHF